MLNNIYKLFTVVGVLSLSTAAQASEDLFANIVVPKDRIVNNLTKAEKDDGWRLLYDGKSSKGWRGAKIKDFPAKGWTVSGGAISIEASDGSESGNAGDIITIKKFSEFILEVDYKLSKGANSGVKYFVDVDLNKGEGSAIGIEFQLIDDVEFLKNYKTSDIKNPRVHMTGALYDMMPANGSYYNKDQLAIPSKPIGSWNTIRIVAKNNRVAHFINGYKVADYVRGNQQWKALVSFSKYKNYPKFGELKEGHISLQDHGNEVHFRSIKIKELNNISTNRRAYKHD